MSTAIYRSEWVVSSLIRDRAERLGDKVAVTTADESITYAALAHRAARFAAGLQRLGVEPGDRVATMLDASLDYLYAWFGVTWAGAIDVPINVDFKGEFLRHILGESQAKVLVLHARWLLRLDGLEVPDLRHVIVVGDADASAAIPFTDLLREAPMAAVRRHERDLVYIMYTSGTTGPSKGVMHSNRSALWNAYSWIDILGLTENDTAYSMFPLFHVTARSAVTTATIWAGGSIALRNGFSVSGFWDDIRATNATFFAYMGSVIHLLYSAPRTDADRRHQVRIAFGAAAPPEIVSQFEQRFGIELFEVYGSTELGPASAPTPGNVVRGTMGKICPHLRVEIHDENDDPVAPGVNGEIVARPAEPEGVFVGYWRNPEATVNAFRNLWFHTGDRGRLDEDGNLIFSDRIKDTIRRRGENISSFEVERTVQSHPDVLEAAAYAVPSDIAEEEVMVAVVVAEGRSLDIAELFRYCIAEMPRFCVPRYVRVVESLPKTPSQRIQKYLLRADGLTADTTDRDALGITIPRA